MSTSSMKHWGNTDDGATLAACAGKALEGIPLTLDETAALLNATGQYQRPLTRDAVMRIEHRALSKLRARFGSFN